MSTRQRVVALMTLAPLVFAAAAACRFGSRRGLGKTGEAVRTRSVPKTRLSLAELVEFQNLLTSRRFEELEARLGVLQGDYEGGQQDATPHVAYKMFRSSDPDLAAHLDAWVDRQPDSPLAHLGRGLYRARKGWLSRDERYISRTARDQLEEMERHFAAARADLEAALAGNPRLMDAYGALIGIAMALGERDVMRQQLDRALQVEPANLGVRETYLFALTSAWGGSRREMQAFCREARRFAAVNPALGTLDAYIVAYEDVHVAAQAGDRKRILELLDQAVRQGAEVFGDRASELYIQGQYREAVADTDRVLEIAPNDVAALETRAMCLYYLGQRQQALEVLTTALDLEPTNDTALGFRARIREESKQFDEALKDYEKALSVRPYGVGLWTQKGRLLLEALGRKSEGEAACAHAVELDGEDAEALYCHGLALAARSDPAAGATLERALAGSTDTRLCTDLAYRYASGLLVPQDQARATSLFTRAAEKGDALAESNLGFRYYDGLGTRRDYAMAVKWWRAAADQGESHAMSGLGTAYAFGNGVGRDPREAARLFRASWEAGYAHGAFNLALSYWRGQGVERDLVTAYVLLNRAATAGDTEAPAKIPSLLREMTPQQIEEGKRRLAEADGHRAP